MPYAGRGKTAKDRKRIRLFEAEREKANAETQANREREEQEDPVTANTVREIMARGIPEWDMNTPTTGWTGYTGPPDVVPEQEWVVEPLQTFDNPIKGWPWRDDPSRSITVVSRSPSCRIYFNSLAASWTS
jgi:hypothetical protein